MRGFTTGVIVVAGMLLSLQGAAAQANPLKELVSVRGTSTIQYERAVGKRADFVVLAQDPLAVPEAQLRTLAVKATYVDGKPVFEAP